MTDTDSPWCDAPYCVWRHHCTRIAEQAVKVAADFDRPCSWTELKEPDIEAAL